MAFLDIVCDHEPYRTEGVQRLQTRGTGLSTDDGFISGITSMVGGRAILLRQRKNVEELVKGIIASASIELMQEGSRSRSRSCAIVWKL